MFTEPQTSAASGDANSPRKFMFERSFDGAPGTRAPERRPVTLKPDQYDALKKENYDAGFAAGHKTGLDEQAERLTALLVLIGGKIDQMLAAMQAVHKNSEANLRCMALAMTKKFVPDLVARNGVQEIEAMLSGVIGDMVHEPRLVVRVSDSQFDTLNEKISAIAEQKAYAGKIVVLADAEVGAGDCRIEWADGGMERNAGQMMETLEKAVTP